VPTRRLAKSLSVRLEIPTDEHAKPDAPWVITTLAGLHKFKRQRYELVVLDEFPRSMMMLASQCVHDPRETVETMRQLCAKSQLSIIASADLSRGFVEQLTRQIHELDPERTAEFIHAVGTMPERVRHLKKCTVAQAIRHVFKLAAKKTESLDSGPIAVSGDTPGMVDELVEALTHRHPDLRVVGIHALSEADLSDPDALAADHDVMVFNSAAGDGINFEKTVFSAIVAIHDFRERSPESVLQGIGRVRKVTDPTVVFGTHNWRIGGRQTNEAKIRARFERIAAAARAHNKKLDVPDEYIDDEPTTAWLVAVEREKNRAWNYHAEGLDSTAQRYGWTIEGRGGDEDEKPDDLLKDEFKEARERIIARRVAARMNAPILTDEEYRKVTAKRGGRTQADVDATARYIVETVFAPVLAAQIGDDRLYALENLLALNLRGKYVERLRRRALVDLLLARREDVLARIDGGGPRVVGAYGCERLRAALRISLATALGMTIGQTFVSAAAEIRKRARGWMESHRELILLGGWHVPETDQQLVNWVRSRFVEIGAERSEKDAREFGRRFYAIEWPDEDHVAAVREAVLRDDAALKASAEQRAEARQMTKSMSELRLLTK